MTCDSRATGLLDRIHIRRRCRIVDVSDEHTRALRRQLSSGCPTDAHRTASDDCYLTFEPAHVASLIFFMLCAVFSMVKW
jgi:hypothetical protein